MYAVGVDAGVVGSAAADVDVAVGVDGVGSADDVAAVVEYVGTEFASEAEIEIGLKLVIAFEDEGVAVGWRAAGFEESFAAPAVG